MGKRRRGVGGAHRRLAGEDDEDGDPYGTGCFETSDIVGQLMDDFAERDANHDGVLSKVEGLNMLKDIFDTDAQNAWRLFVKADQNKDMYIDVEEYLDIAYTHRSELKLSARGYLSESCRNHHWGLISLCKPKVVVAEFRVQNVHSQPGGFRDLGVFLHVALRFEALGTNQDSGWYQVQIDMYGGKAPGIHSVYSLVMCATSIVLMTTLLLIDLVLTVTSWPRNLVRLWQFRIRPSPGLKGRVYEMRKLRRYLTSLLDGREVRLYFLNTTWLFLELVIGVCFVGAVLSSVFCATESTVIPMGRGDDKDCIDTFFVEDIAYAKQMLHGQVGNVRRGISPVSFIWHCREQDGALWQMIAILYETLFSSRLHAGVTVLLFIRCIQAFEFTQYLNWLPATLRLAAAKLANFMLMFILIVTGFAVLMHLSFGRFYWQYSSVWKACVSLLFYSFGMVDRAMEGTHPFIDDVSTVVVIYLFFFLVTVVTIGLNVFTTIVLEAFAMASTAEGATKVKKERNLKIPRVLQQFFFIADTEDEDEDEDDDQELVGFEDDVEGGRSTKSSRSGTPSKSALHESGAGSVLSRFTASKTEMQRHIRW